AAARAVIRADFPTLLQLLEGRIDGDALLFSRDLAVEGDMEVVVALRNALDGAGIDLVADLASLFGPFAAPAESAARQAIRLGGRLGGRLGEHLGRRLGERPHRHPVATPRAAP